jgi:hypothetical protein
LKVQKPIGFSMMRVFEDSPKCVMKKGRCPK